MGSMTASNVDGVFEATHGSIRAARTPGGNITIDTTHTRFGLIRSLGGFPHIEIERADLDDVIAALQALRGDWGPGPDVGDSVEVAGARSGQRGTVMRNQGGRLPWVVRHSDGCETGYAAHEIRPWPGAALSSSKSCGHATYNVTCRSCASEWEARNPVREPLPRRPRPEVLRELRAYVVGRPPSDAVAVALFGLIDELGGT